MIILTDGRPYDVDYGTLDYAIADTKKAMQEVRVVADATKLNRSLQITSDGSSNKEPDWVPAPKGSRQ